MIRAVFFDVANTLLDKPELYPNILKVLSRHGYSVDIVMLARRHRLLSEFMDFPDKTSRGFYDQFNSQLLLALGIIPTAPLLDDVFQACTYLPWREFEDVVALREIALPKGVISNWDKSLPDKLRDLVRLDFQWILGSELMMVRKPQPAFYEYAIKASGFNADEILYIGDSLKLDVQPANILGIRTVLIDRLDLYPFATVPRIRDFNELERFL
jgi:FMN phosphatase YigB (HAD superfamily)